MSDVARFYDDMAWYYHLLMEDWEASIARQRSVLGELLERVLGKGDKRILDAACGIGTQSIGLAQLGYRVTGSDLSPAAIERAKREAFQRSLDIDFRVADLRVLSGYHAGPFEVVAAMDNALPHLESQEEMVSAIREMASLIAPGGLFLASVRDYDSLLEEKPSVTDARVFGSGKDRRIVFQVWDWRRDDRGYRIHQYIVRHLDEGEIETRVFTTTYWAWKRRDLEYILNLLDLEKSDWLEPKDTGFFQPILMARKTA